MAIKELRKLRKTAEGRSKANSISALQNRGKIRLIVNDKGYVCYDTDELTAYKKTRRLGRPPKTVR